MKLRDRGAMVDEPGLHRAEGRPARAVALVIASRVVLVVLLIVAGAATWSALSPAQAGAGSREAVVAPLRTGDEGPDDGVTLAELVGGIERAVVDAAADLAAFEAGRPEARWVPVRLVVDVPGGTSSLTRVLAGIERVGVIEVRADAVTATPTGRRTEVTGRMLLSGRRLTPDGVVGRDARMVVALSEDVERAGARLRRLQVEALDGPIIRVEVEGPSTAIVQLLATLELRYAAPARLESLSIRSVDAGERTATISFRPREDPA